MKHVKPSSSLASNWREGDTMQDGVKPFSTWLESSGDVKPGKDRANRKRGDKGENLGKCHKEEKEKASDIHALGEIEGQVSKKG